MIESFASATAHRPNSIPPSPNFVPYKAAPKSRVGPQVTSTLAGAILCAILAGLP